MIGRHPRQERPSNWEPELKVPPTTLWLPLGNDLAANEIGRRAAAKVLGEGTQKDRLQKFASVVSDGVTDCRRRDVKLGGLLFFPDYNRLPPIANIDVTGHYSNDPQKPNSLEFYRQVYGEPDKDTVAPIEMASLELPAGPAVRFHRRFWPKAGKDSVSHQWEEVIYAILPPKIEAAVVLRVAWVEFSFSEALINMADAIAPTLEIKLLDA